MAKYAQEWIDNYAKKNIKYRYWYHKNKLIDLPETLDTNNDLSFVDLSVISGMSIHQIKSILDDE